MFGMEQQEMERSRWCSKWVATVASIWIQCTSGSNYTFAIYSPVLKSTQFYDQSTLDTVATFKDLGANAGILSGLLYSSVAVPDLSPSAPGLGRGAPWVVLAAGAAQCFTGYFLMWLSVVGALPRPPLPVMCLFMLLAAHAQTFFNTTDVVTAVHNFPDYGGTAVSIMKGFLGLSGAILIQVYQTIFKNNPASYLLMLALLPTLNSLSFMFLVRIYGARECNEKRHLNGFSVIALGLAAYLMILIILKNVLSFSSLASIFTLVALVLMLISPLLIAINAKREAFSSLWHRPVTESDETSDGSGKMLLKATPVEDPGLDEQHVLKMQHPAENLNLLQSMCTVNFWLLFLAMACGMGSGLATANNISQIGGSLGYTDSETSTLVSLWSIWNFLGRFGAGYLSDHFLRTRGWERPLFMAATLAAMSIGHSMIALGFPGALYAGSVVVGVCYGSQWSLMATITYEIFGTRHMGTIFNTITMASPVGSYIFSVRVAGYVYDREATKGNVCIGVHCFFLSFLIMASACLLGCLAAFGLFFRTRRFYARNFL